MRVVVCSGLSSGTRIGADVGCGIARGDFPAAPKDGREVKGGNVSRTFRM